MTRSRPKRDTALQVKAKRDVLATLRQVCSSLRAMQRDAAVVRAYRDVEALLAREQRRSATIGRRRTNRRSA